MELAATLAEEEESTVDEVKTEECCDGGGTSSTIDLVTSNDPKIEAFDFEARIGVNEGSSNTPSSSRNQLRSELVGMGFAPALIDSAIERHGAEDIDVLIDALCAKTDAATSNTEYTRDPIHDHDSDDNDFCFEFSSSDSEEIEEKKPDTNVDKKAWLLKMKFSEEQIDLALSRLGCGASLPKVIDFIISDRVGGSSGKQSRTDEVLHELFEVRDITLKLLDMGFTEEEISTAIEIFGPAVAVDELADSIFANRIAYGCVKGETDTFLDKDCNLNQNESKCIGQTINGTSDTDEWETKPSTSSDTLREWKDLTATERKRSRLQDVPPAKQKAKMGRAVLSSYKYSVDISEYEEKLFDNKVPTKRVCDPSNSKYRPSPPPYVFFGNMADSSQETWDKLSRFLYGFDPEFANAQFFSALIRKEGYFHNLPTTNRFHILPRPPMTIEKALPETRKWWPSWDTRKQLGCINSDCTDVVQTCERLGKTMMSSRGILSKEQQTDILHQCKTLNLLWVGEKKLQPLKADHVENILGYPVGHTNITGLEEPDRLIALKFSFQIDTLGYHLSTLKPLYPVGIRVLSIFTGIGGAEIALTKLGIHLLCVISVEASEINCAIFKRWWRSSGQSGELRQVGGIDKLRGQKIDRLLEEFGGIDLIISGNPHNYVYGNPHVHDADGVDFTLFCESVRIYQHVRNVMVRRASHASR